MRFRQVHLDFHTSEHIPAIGAQFDKVQFQSMLKLGHVDSITIFSKCHHGWSYHPTSVSVQHPNLTFDLLGAQIEAAHEIDVKTPVYISAGLDEKLARLHPEWLIRKPNEETVWVRDFLTAGYHEFCFNSPYLDVLVAQIEEVVQNYDADGIFLDIVGIRECYCQNCIRSARERGINPLDKAEMYVLWEETYARYTERTNAAAQQFKPEISVFHNGSHIAHGRRDLALRNTQHLELESLPTGGWGYDHFPMSARYVQQLGLPFLGMTGKFHLSWGEFGGFKHPNALRYEAALSLANGARCSIGDQLHPDGAMDEATYRLIGAAYGEVEEKEAWCVDVTNTADIALFSVAAAIAEGYIPGERSTNSLSDTGAARMLLEGHYLFDLVDSISDWTTYSVLILPDKISINPTLAAKLNEYVLQGGKVLATGESGLDPNGSGFAVDCGAKWLSVNPYCPDFFVPAMDFGYLGKAEFVMYGQGQKIEESGGETLGLRENPYFNRDFNHFSSHQHTPGDKQSREPGMTEGPAGIYIAWNLFEDYAKKGSLMQRNIVQYALDRLLAAGKTLRTSLPAQGVTTIQSQDSNNRLVHHLLYASPVRRGENIEIIEDILPLYDIHNEVRTNREVSGVYLAPQNEPLPFVYKDGVVSYTLPKLLCHQMIVIDF
ncbi:MAG: beta-galactosidase trimerization domain-containing protein [Gorillibacterium sp.]|nr:beta-galactosidase trimerization domain-containing protein [Gorillibacterium sp.]